MFSPVHNVSRGRAGWPARLAILGAAVTLGCGLPASANADSLTCGSVITQDTTLSSDLRGCPGDGLVIGGPGVTLNLAGHTISGTGNGNGVASSDRGTTVENGTVSNFARGAIVGSGTVTRLRLAHNGVGLFTVGTATLTENWVVANGTGLVLFEGRGPITVKGNVFARNQGDGVDGDTEAEPVDYEDNAFLNNGGNGLSVEDATSRIVRNLAAGNGANGIYVIDPTEGEFFPYFFADNAAYRNGGLGIWFARPADELAGTDGGGNVAARNGDPRQCVNIQCAARTRSRSDLPDGRRFRRHRAAGPR